MAAAFNGRAVVRARLFRWWGSGLTAFALGRKGFSRTGSVTRMGTLVMFANPLPGILLSPVRWAQL